MLLLFIPPILILSLLVDIIMTMLIIDMAKSLRAQMVATVGRMSVLAFLKRIIMYTLWQLTLPLQIKSMPGVDKVFSKVLLVVPVGLI